VLLYVDDMIITGNDEMEVDKLRDELAIRFDIKKLGELHHFLGLEVTNLASGIFLSQEIYAKKLVERIGVNQSKRCSTPLEANKKLRREEGSLLANPQPYRALVGSLLYLTITRPDISFSVGLVSRFMQSPKKPHLEAAKKILKYVTSSLVGFTDADFGGDLDDRRSTLGYVFLSGGTSISWCSKKQNSVSLSTTEVEYKTAALAAQECIWLQRLANDLHLPIIKPTTLFGDNQSALKLTNNPVFHARTKHIEIEHHFIREKVLDNTIDALEVRSEENIADIFAKSLSKTSFEFLRAKLGLISKKSL